MYIQCILYTYLFALHSQERIDLQTATHNVKVKLKGEK